MLLNTKTLLDVAEKNNFTIGAFNVTELSNFKCVFETAEELNAPCIIAVAETEFDLCGIEYFEYIKHCLKESAIPFALHLDHGHTEEKCMQAIQAGFTSVMIDGSSLNYKDNVELTKRVVQFAHLGNVSVEGELGTIGALNVKDDEGAAADKIIYTQPEEVQDFISKTNCDLLAIAIGTSHGIYAKGCEPKLQIELLKEIKAVTSVPLVLHGGSSNLDEEIKKACDAGIRKINIASEYKAAMSHSLYEQMKDHGEIKYALMMPNSIVEGKKVVAHKMKLFHSVDKARLYY